ncbi:MAG: hypothetical protein JSR61_10925 [Proteobacteria bacterium]|nr:hypothetical protein [Pseudomonadota bacterium]
MASAKARMVARVATGTMVLGLMALGLAACSSSSKNVEPDANIFPKDYKLELMNTLQRELDDPTNIRDAFISEPFLTTASREQRYAVCVRSNSRDLNHTYTGSKDRIGFFYAGHLNQLIDATPEQCGKVAYKPWPELQKICFSDKGCK